MKTFFLLLVTIIVVVGSVAWGKVGLDYLRDKKAAEDYGICMTNCIDSHRYDFKFQIAQCGCY